MKDTAVSSAEVGESSSHPVVKTEQLQSLVEFANGLEACSEHGIVVEDDDKKSNVHQEALLLMSIAHQKISDIERRPSWSSESSLCSSKKENSFRFTCPSLSLEQCPGAKSSCISKPSNNDICNRIAPRRVSDCEKESCEENQQKLPSVLLKRPLTIDDRDALRLSADAMARNIHESYQKAIDWRINSWVKQLSAQLVRQEQQMLSEGSTISDLRVLLKSPEAWLLVALRESKLVVTGSDTSFRLVTDYEENGVIKADCFMPASKKRRTRDATAASESLSSSLHSEVQQVSQAMELECIISLQTPCGHVEVTLEVPGTMHAGFMAGEEMKSVALDVDTNILSAMMEKSCRQLVRTSVESILERGVKSGSTAEETSTGATETTAPSTPLKSTTSPVSRSTAQADPAAPVRNLVSPPPHPRQLTLLSSPPPAFSIPNDFSSKSPRRISPQPVPMMATPFNSIAALVSPPCYDGKEKYHEVVPGRGPSLPVLVEVACRAMLGP